jgi:hypothetical protein
MCGTQRSSRRTTLHRMWVRQQGARQGPDTPSCNPSTVAAPLTWRSVPNVGPLRTALMLTCCTVLKHNDTRHPY